MSGLTGTAAAAAPTVPIILAWGAAIAMVGIGIGFAATGIAILVESMRRSIKVMPQIIGYLGILAAYGVIAMGVLMGLGSAFGFAGMMAKMGWAPIMAIGAAVLMMGIALFMGAHAFDIFATAVERIVNADMVGMMAMFTIGVIGLAFAVLKWHQKLSCRFLLL